MSQIFYDQTCYEVPNSKLGHSAGKNIDEEKKGEDEKARKEYW